jgi:hypothetical protein
MASKVGGMTVVARAVLVTASTHASDSQSSRVI